MDTLLIQELIKVRLVGSNKMLRPFLQRLETWELLLIVHMLSGDGRYGIEDYLENLQTLKCTRLTMRNFIRDRIAEGTFLVTKGDKKSRKSLALSDELQRELEECFGMIKSTSGYGAIGIQLPTFQTQSNSEIKL
ncbi:hypothetical protein [Roseicyclus mahoneyensis]|uniref:hypothetical protein n=1 Tax=Roseicyclus mahoneyensis TaxID=164332 RepID=UPI0011B29CE6|nr:hypothetical protein [Roseicyclus mahoneyensis]